MKTIYSAGSQQTKVRLFMWASLILSALAIYFGIDLAQHYGLNPGDGGVLRPLGERLAWGIGVGLLGVLLAAGMDLYGRLYVTRVQYEKASRCLYFDTIRWWGTATLQVNAQEIQRANYNDGRMETGEHTVNAPWYYVQIQGRRLPLILDAQGKLEDKSLAHTLLKI